MAASSVCTLNQAGQKPTQMKLPKLRKHVYAVSEIRTQDPISAIAVHSPDTTSTSCFALRASDGRVLGSRGPSGVGITMTMLAGRELLG